MAKGNAGKWPDWEESNLFLLLESAAASPALDWIPPLADRRVRNALAHGQPHIVLDLDECRFHDRKIKVTWEFDDFFQYTKYLTLTARVLSEFEVVLGHVQAHTLVEQTWSRFASGSTQARNP